VHVGLLILPILSFNFSSEQKSNNVLYVTWENINEETLLQTELVPALTDSPSVPQVEHPSDQQRRRPHDALTSSNPLEIVVPSYSQISEWSTEHVREQEYKNHKYINISQPRANSLAKQYVDTALQRRANWGAPSRFVYQEGVTKSIVFGGRKFCFLINSTATSLAVTPVNCDRNLWFNHLQTLVPDKDLRYLLMPAESLVENDQ
jgi:hypothetical protein